MGTFLESENEGLEEPVRDSSANNPAFAVFDGMGGEQRGEMAAYLAARAFDSVCDEASRQCNIKQFLLNVCVKMNQSICAFAKENRVSRTGTTVAALVFGEKEVFLCNVGDSRIYQYRRKKLAQISHDHVEPSPDKHRPSEHAEHAEHASPSEHAERSPAKHRKKSPLTQHLGIVETEFLLEPYIAKGDCRIGDKYLICSDGLTDMVAEKEIATAFSTHHDLGVCAGELLRQALGNGGVDNITLILCEVCRKKRGFKRFGKTRAAERDAKAVKAEGKVAALDGETENGN
jgi:protein phosphatase